MNNYRKVLEKHIGRNLNSSELVHHKDENQLNNKLGNLLLTNRKEHPGLHKTTRRNWSKRKGMVANECLKNIEILNIKYFTDALNTLFTGRQQNIIFKKLKGKTLSKTETEYYSRIIRKKIVALSNDTLSNLAQFLIYK